MKKTEQTRKNKFNKELTEPSSTHGFSHVLNHRHRRYLGWSHQLVSVKKIGFTKRKTAGCPKTKSSSCGLAK